MYEHGIHGRIVEDRLQGETVDIQIGAAVLLDGGPDIDRVGDGHPFGEEASQANLRCLGEFRNGKVLLFHEIGGHDARSAAEGDDGDTALGFILPGGIEGQCPAEIDKLLEISRFISPGLGEGRPRQPGNSQPDWRCD